MKNIKLLPLIAIAALGVSACSSGSSSSPPFVEPPPPPPPAATVFTSFVQDQFAATSDSTDPVDVDEVEFDFANEDPTAYDNLLQ